MVLLLSGLKLWVPTTTTTCYCCCATSTLFRRRTHLSLSLSVCLSLSLSLGALRRLNLMFHPPLPSCLLFCSSRPRAVGCDDPAPLPGVHQIRGRARPRRYPGMPDQLRREIAATLVRCMAHTLIGIPLNVPLLIESTPVTTYPTDLGGHPGDPILFATSLSTLIRGSGLAACHIRDRFLRPDRARFNLHALLITMSSFLWASFG